MIKTQIWPDLFFKENLPEMLQDATGHVVDWDSRESREPNLHEREVLFLSR